jgi:hypothetical protein
MTLSDVFRGRVISEEKCGYREKTIQHALGLPSAKEEWKPFVWKMLEFLNAFFFGPLTVSVIPILGFFVKG